MENPNDAYMRWAAEPTPDNMHQVISSLHPTINSEIHRFDGPANLLRTKAKVLAAKAIKSYDPNSGAKLQSWTTTQLQPLARYSTQMNQQVGIPERITREAAALDAKNKEFIDLNDREPDDDELSGFAGISPKRIRRIRESFKKTISDAPGGEQGATVDASQGDDSLQSAATMVAADLDERDSFIFRHRTGQDGTEVLPAKEIARRLGISPAAVTQRAARIGTSINEVRGRV